MGSVYFDGIDDYLIVDGVDDFNLSNNDFTINCWVYDVSDWTSVYRILSSGDKTQGFMWTCGIGQYWGGGYKINFSCWNGTSYEDWLSDAIDLSSNKLHHVAITRSNNILYFFHNAILCGSSSITRNITPIGDYSYVGAAKHESVSEFFRGNIDELHFINGYALWTSDFILPDRQYPQIYANRFGTTQFNVNLDTTLTNLKSAWKFDPNYGIIRDFVGTYDNLTITGNAIEIEGMDENGIYLDSVSKMSLSSDTPTLNNDFTLSIWAKRIGNASGGSGNGYVIAKDSGTEQISINWKDDDTINVSNEFDSISSSSYSVSSGNWHNIILVGSGTTCYFYIDSVLKEQIDNWVTDSNLYSFDITGRSENSDNWFDGDIDEIYYWNTALTTDQVSLLYNLGSGIFYKYYGNLNMKDTVLLIQGNGPNNSTKFIDSSDKVNQITPYNGVKISEDEYVFNGSSIYFDGINDYLLVSDSDNWNFGIYDYSIKFWINTVQNPSSGAGNDVGLIVRPITSNNQFGIYLTNGGIVYVYELISGVVGANFYGSGIVNDGNWHSVLVVRKDSIVSLYINDIYDNGDSSSLDINFSQDLYVGNDPNNKPFNGYLDEIIIVKGRAL